MLEPLPAADLALANAELRQQLLEAQELIEALRTGAVDALAVQGPDGPQIFTLEGADQGYRNLIEQMGEGAVLLDPATATVLYANACLAAWLARPLEGLMGSSFLALVEPAAQPYWRALLARAAAHGHGRGEGQLLPVAGAARPVAAAPQRCGRGPQRLCGV